MDTAATTTSTLEQITSHYLSSSDFNGTLITDLGRDAEEIRRALTELLLDDKIALNFGDRHENPYILALEPEPQNVQIEKLERLVFGPPKYEQYGPFSMQINSVNCCAYPSRSHLQTVVDQMQYAGRPYTLLLALGEPQLSMCFLSFMF